MGGYTSKHKGSFKVQVLILPDPYFTEICAALLIFQNI